MALRIVEVKTNVSGLAIGMHVCRLDRPWLETPFPFQGFRINSVQDIDRVKRYCDYVYVDVEKGIAPASQFRAGKTPEPDHAADNEYNRLRKHVYEIAHQFEEELPEAEEVHDALSKNICEVMDDLSNGKKLDLEAIQGGVDAMLNSVLRNPTAFLWVNRLKRSDTYTYSHLIGTSIWCGVFGRYLGLERAKLEVLTLGGLLIDVGKAKLPPELLSKTEPLTDAEYELIKRHVDFGVRILVESKNIPPPVLRIVATHHERWNGHGYPLGLRGKEIPVFGRIVGLIDSYEAMTAPRPFSPGVSPHKAVGEFYENRGAAFEAALVEQFIRACGIYPTGSLVELTSGEVAIVVGLEGTMRLRPKIMLLLDGKKRPYSELQTIDLSKERPDLAVRRGLAPGAYGINMEEIML